MKIKVGIGVIALSVAISVEAQTFSVLKVVLKNGKIFETRYQPQKQNYFGKEYLVFYTDIANKVAIPLEEVEEVSSEIEETGFGKIINTTTIDLGIIPTLADLVLEEALGPEGETTEGEGTAANWLSKYNRLRKWAKERTQGAQPTGRVINTQQFAEPSAAGGGFPVSFSVGRIP